MVGFKLDLSISILTLAEALLKFFGDCFLKYLHIVGDLLLELLIEFNIQLERALSQFNMNVNKETKKIESKQYILKSSIFIFHIILVLDTKFSQIEKWDKNIRTIFFSYLLHFCLSTNPHSSLSLLVSPVFFPVNYLVRWSYCSFTRVKKYLHHSGS